MQALLRRLFHVSIVCALLFGLAPGGLAAGISVAEAATLYMTVHMVDTNDSGYIIQLPNGKIMVVDAGDSTEYSHFASHLNALVIAKIDYLVGTHEHGDHIANMNNIIANYNIGAVFFQTTLLTRIKTTSTW